MHRSGITRTPIAAATMTFSDSAVRKPFSARGTLEDPEEARKAAKREAAKARYRATAKAKRDARAVESIAAAIAGLRAELGMEGPSEYESPMAEYDALMEASRAKRQAGAKDRKCDAKLYEEWGDKNEADRDAMWPAHRMLIAASYAEMNARADAAKTEVKAARERAKEDARNARRDERADGQAERARQDAEYQAWPVATADERASARANARTTLTEKRKADRQLERESERKAELAEMVSGAPPDAPVSTFKWPTMPDIKPVAPEPMGAATRTLNRQITEAKQTEAISAGGPRQAEAARDVQVKQALKRFVRNRNLPEEMENLRRNLIAARVLSGMTAVEAAEKFGYENSTQISLIESGERPIPNDHRFLRQAAIVYFVSSDFLLGMSPHMEYDSKVTQQHALLRGTERLMTGIATTFAAVAGKLETEGPRQDDINCLTAAIERVESAIAVLRKHGLDDLRGSASLLNAVETLTGAAAPLRKSAKVYRGLSDYLDDVREGRMPVIPHLMERVNPEAMMRELIVGDDDE